MEKAIQFPTPPWDMETAAARLKFEENAWNSGDQVLILKGYAPNIEMRDGPVFISGIEELKTFVKGKLASLSGYHLRLDLWGALKGRMAVRFDAEWMDASGHTRHAYGVQVLQFNEQGQIEQRYASQELA